MNEIIKSVLEKELESKDLIFPFISGLTNREKLVLELRSQNKKLEEIGEQMTPKLSRERVRQIEEKAKEKIAFQKKIIETIADKLGEVVFEENDVRVAFEKWYNGTWDDGSEKDLVEGKIQSQEFIKFLWETKTKQK